MTYRAAILWAVVAASLVAAMLMPGGGSNWELMRTAVDEVLHGGNPYLPSAAQQASAVNLSFPYAPIWIPAVGALVTAGSSLWVLLSAFLFGLWLLPREYRDKPLCGLLGMSLFTTLHSGNIAALEFVGICGVFRLAHAGKMERAGGLLGFLATLKLLPVSFVVGLGSWRARWACVALFIGCLTVGFGARPDMVSEYLRCVAGVQGQPSVVSELSVTGMDNQAVYGRGVWMILAALIVVGYAARVLWLEKKSPAERLAVAMLATFLLWPRIPPHAFLAYASVPVLVLYQGAGERMKWGIVVAMLASGWLLVCRSAGVPIPDTLQYWLTAGVFVSLALQPQEKWVGLKTETA